MSQSRPACPRSSTTLGLPRPTKHPSVASPRRSFPRTALVCTVLGYAGQFHHDVLLPFRSAPVPATFAWSVSPSLTPSLITEPSKCAAIASARRQDRATQAREE